METILQTYNLQKNYKDKSVINNVNIKVSKGEIYGLLGENGAGKTTLLKLITGLIKPTSGRIEIFGEEIVRNNYKYLRRIGSLIGQTILYEDLSAIDNLEIHSEYLGYYKSNKLNETLELVGLNGDDNKPLKHYSLGMKQKLSIAKAILTKPELIILDEPINFLDPLGVRDMRSLLYTLSKEYGITVLITNHILSELEQVVDTIGIIKSGELKKQISMKEIYKGKIDFCIIEAKEIEKVSTILSEIFNISDFKIVSKNKLQIYENKINYNEILKELIKNGIEIDLFHKKKGSLENYFLDYIGDETNA